MSRKKTQKVILTDDEIEEILKYARCGVHNEQIAKLMNMAASTFYLLMKESPELATQVAEAKGLANIEAEESLYKQAVGYTKTEKKVVVLGGGLHNASVSEVVEYDRYYPPNFSATKHYLNNRNPDRWKDSKHLEIDLTTISDRELAKLAKEALEEDGEDEEGYSLS